VRSNAGPFACADAAVADAAVADAAVSDAAVGVLTCRARTCAESCVVSQFCTKCGNSSLVRLQAVLDAQRGGMRLLPEAGAPARVRSTNTRGTKFPMPKPQHGRHATNLILAEDQLDEANQKYHRQGKARTSADAHTVHALSPACVPPLLTGACALCVLCREARRLRPGLLDRRPLRPVGQEGRGG
jgi:hypothetical protein